jgi:hypothetical protein
MILSAQSVPGRAEKILEAEVYTQGVTVDRVFAQSDI